MVNSGEANITPTTGAVANAKREIVWPGGTANLMYFAISGSNTIRHYRNRVLQRTISVGGEPQGVTDLQKGDRLVVITTGQMVLLPGWRL